MILFVAGDPGGSRAILPVAQAFLNSGREVAIVDHGVLGTEAPKHMLDFVLSENTALENIPNFKAVIFGSSVSDPFPLDLARKAQRFGAVITHVLDNWSFYIERLQTDGLPPMFPDIYTVIDETARLQAIEAGIPEKIIKITGQPALAVTTGDIEEIFNKSKGVTTRAGKNRALNLGFISEPFVRVFGHDVTIKNHPGFTEESVLLQIIEALNALDANVFLNILPHPKQDAEDLRKLLMESKGNIRGCVFSKPMGSSIFPELDGVIGMASILFYQAWLGGLPAFCVQPNCQLEFMKRYRLLEDVCVADCYDSIPSKMEAFLDLCANHTPTFRKDLFLHKCAPQNIMKLLLNLMGDSI